MDWITPPTAINRLRSRIRGKKSLKALRAEGQGVDTFLTQVPGLIHVGAHLAQERGLYLALGLQVIWVEANPAIFKRLEKVLRGWPDQRPYCALLTETDGEDVDFFLSSNDGASSSVLRPGRLQEMWPSVDLDDKIRLRTQRMDSFAQQHKIDMRQYPGLVMDTQGSELQVLKGAGKLLSKFRFIKTEAMDFEAYENACLLKDIEEFLAPRGFREIARDLIAHKEGVGSAFDVTFESTRWHSG
jgi:FkbM family methyltransferase